MAAGTMTSTTSRAWSTSCRRRRRRRLPGHPASTGGRGGVLAVLERTQCGSIPNGGANCVEALCSRHPACQRARRRSLAHRHPCDAGCAIRLDQGEAEACRGSRSAPYPARTRRSSTCAVGQMPSAPPWERHSGRSWQPSLGPARSLPDPCSRATSSSVRRPSTSSAASPWWRPSWGMANSCRRARRRRGSRGHARRALRHAAPDL